MARSAQVGDAGPADLVVVAPTTDECRAPGWLARAARTVAGALGADGVAFVLPPRLWRARLLGTVRAQGLVVGPTIFHLPELAWSRHFVTAGAMHYATACVVPRSSWRGRAASLAARVPGGTRVLAQTDLASVVVRKPGAAPLLRWLAEAAGTFDPDRVVVTRTWRAQGGSFTVAVVDDGSAGPRLVARVGSGPPAARAALGEARALETFAASAQAAGASVPRPLASFDLRGAPVLVETGVPGRVAATTLSERPGEARAVLERVLAWLLQWNRSTAARATLTATLLADEVLEPARRVAPALPSGDAYVRRLEQLCGDAEGAPVTLAAAHDDLTTMNVLLTRDGSIGVVDWDTARADALPLVDFFYTVVDAYTASERYLDRARAFDDCFSVAGRHAEAVRARRSPFERALGLTPEVLELAFHACWLHHAANEVARGETDGPFLAIARQLAADPGEFSP